jgi:hypothetical protein
LLFLELCYLGISLLGTLLLAIFARYNLCPDTICAPIQFVTRYNLCPIQIVPIQFVPIQFVPDTICADTICTWTDFEAGNIHYEGHYKGWALKSRLFCALKWPNERSERHWGPNGTRLSARCHFSSPKKLSISRTQPPPTCPSNRCCPHQKHYAQGRIDHRCIYM